MAVGEENPYLHLDELARNNQRHPTPSLPPHRSKSSSSISPRPSNIPPSNPNPRTHTTPPLSLPLFLPLPLPFTFLERMLRHKLTLLDHRIHRIQITHEITCPVLEPGMEDLQFEREEAVEDVGARG